MSVLQADRRRLVDLAQIGARHLHQDRHLRPNLSVWTFAECPERDCRIAREAEGDLSEPTQQQLITEVTR